MRKLMEKVLSVGVDDTREHDDIDMDTGLTSGPRLQHHNPVIAVAACLDLTAPSTLPALRTLLKSYSKNPPLAIVLMGPFATSSATFLPQIRPPAVLSAGASLTNSIDYKEAFDSLAALLAEFPTLIARTTLVFVPADADPWPSAIGGGVAVPIPRKGVPELFTRRVKRVGLDASRAVPSGSTTTAATADGQPSSSSKETKGGEIVWTSNPSRISWFGCTGEMVLFRDDILGRLQRQAISLPTEEAAAEAAAVEAEMNLEDPIPDAEADIAIARRLTKTIVDQAYLSPFPINTRPIHTDYASSLRLTPLPTALVLADADAPPWALQYLGCWVMNPGSIVMMDGDSGSATDATKTTTPAPITVTEGGDKTKGKKGRDTLFGNRRKTEARPTGPARWVEFDVRLGKGRVRIEKP